MLREPAKKVILLMAGPFLFILGPTPLPRLIGEDEKKKFLLNGSAIKGGGGKALVFKPNYFFILLPFENKKYITLDNLSKCGHITLKFVGRYFYWFVTIFAKKYGYFSIKIGGRKKN